MTDKPRHHYSAKIILYDDAGSRILNTGLIDLDSALTQLDTIISKKLKHDSETYLQWKQQNRGNA
jgi:hypothetical protein